MLGLAKAKSILKGDYWIYSSLGAPYDSPKFDFSANFLYNFDMLVKKLISLFAWEPSAINNWFFLLIFPMCAISAFYVLRSLSIKRPLSLFGAVLFELSPYIFQRNTGHINLSAFLCFFFRAVDQIIKAVDLLLLSVTAVQESFALPGKEGQCLRLALHKAPDDSRHDVV